MTLDLQDATPAETAASLREAFRQLHGARLHGFALLVSLGDERRAERAAGEALAAGETRAASLRHPERAAAWIRAQALSALRDAPPPSRSDEAGRRAALDALGVSPMAYDGLAALKVDERATLVASLIERFEALDIETILGSEPAATRRAISRARQRYLAAVTGRRSAAGPGDPATGNPNVRGALAERVAAIAQRTFSDGRAEHDA
jgi:hypothetical protein